MAIDQGTSSSRVAIFDHNLQIKQLSSKPLNCLYPQNDYVEQNPREIISDVRFLIEEALSNAGLKPKDILGVGIANQRETIVVWDKKTGEAIHPAIVWQDRRTGSDCQHLKDEGLEEMIQQKTGLLLDPYFSATKIRWILRKVPGALKKAQQGDLLCGTIDSFILYHLSGFKDHVCDITNASRTLLFNIEKECWDIDLLELFDIPISMLPRVCANDGMKVLAKDFGFYIYTAMGDQQAASLGQCCTEPGDIKVTYGSGAFLMQNTGQQIQHSQHRLLSTILYRLQGQTTFAIEGSLLNAGTVVQWLQDQLHIGTDMASLSDQVAALKDNGGVYFVPALTGLGAPYWHPEAKGMIYGIGRNTSSDHILRAGLEGIVYSTRDLLEAMRKDGGTWPERICIDGGMSQNAFFGHFLAQVCQLKVQVPMMIESTILGAASMAGLSCGLFSDVSALRQIQKIQACYKADIDGSYYYKQWLQVVKKVLL